MLWRSVRQTQRGLLDAEVRLPTSELRLRLDRRRLTRRDTYWRVNWEGYINSPQATPFPGS